MIYTIQRDPYLKRLPSVIDRVYEIQAYDVDNLYPQRADEVRNGSFTLKSAVDRITDFIKGQGWEDPNLANLIVNGEGMTANDVLDMIAQDKSPFAGFALHFKYNLNFRIAEITPIEWMYTRLGLPNERGHVDDIKYSTNWERDPSKVLHDPYVIESYHTFNPDPNVVRTQMENCGGWQNYPGQILYWTPKPGKYPKSRFDAAFDYAQAQAEIGVASVSGIQNKFSAQHIFRYPGEFPDDKAAEKFKQGMAEFQGAKGTNSTLVVEDPSRGEGPARPLVESIQMQNTDKMYEFTSKDARNALRETLAVPAPILGQLPESGMFNQEQIRDSYDYMNVMTSGDRDQIVRVFKKIFTFWKDAITIGTFNIRPLMYGGAPASGTPSPNGTPAGQPGQPGQTAPGQPAAAPARAVDETLTRLDPKQTQHLLRVMRLVERGKMSREAGLVMLKAYGFTEDELNIFLPEGDAL